MSSSAELAATSAPGGVPSDVIGALPLGAGRCAFRVWAPAAQQVAVVLVERGGEPIPLEPVERGYHAGIIAGVAAGDRYLYELDGERRLPDPASRSQPDGVHGPSAIVDPAFDWQVDRWTPPRLQDCVIYELHVGTFTAEGTFDAAAERLDELRWLGVNAIELMPVAQFPGDRNWGYDGVFAYAAQHSYGGAAGLKRFIDRCHGLDMAVILDVVYNHLGPEGNYLAEFGPYFIDRYRTPWGDALNFDGPDSDEVREYFIRSALQWIDEFRIDGLRLDAIHAILDTSAQPFLQQLAARVNACARAADRTTMLIAESDLGDPRVIRSADRGGLRMDAQWLDDFHHALHALLTGEQDGYYVDYGRLEHLARCLREGYVYSGQYSQYRRRSHGAPAADAAPRQFVVCIQNHDQIGNRMHGDRLTALVDFERLKLAAAATLLSPFTPLLYMGEEYGEVAPFPYFVSHSDPALVAAVRAGRRAEFAAFAWAGEPPDPQAVDTFRSARLDWRLRERSPHRELLAYYRELIGLRAELPKHERLDDRSFAVHIDRGTGRTLVIRRQARDRHVLIMLHFAGDAAAIRLPVTAGRWRRRLDSADARWRGPGSRLPSDLDVANGELLVELAPYAAIMLTRQTGS